MTSGRLLSRDRAFAALDTMLGLGVFDKDELWDGDRPLPRDARRASAARLRPARGSAAPSRRASRSLRLRWLDLRALPRPELQIEVERPVSWSYWLDLGVEELRFAVEYDGEEWHRRTPEQRARDRKRRTWLRDERGWIIEPVTKENVFGHAP